MEAKEIKKQASKQASNERINRIGGRGQRDNENSKADQCNILGYSYIGGDR